MGNKVSQAQNEMFPHDLLYMWNYLMEVESRMVLSEAADSCPPPPFH